MQQLDSIIQDTSICKSHQEQGVILRKRFKAN